MRTRWNKQPGLDFLSAHLIDYPSPTNLGYLWGIGSTAGLCLGIQIVTGIFLAMHYTAHVDLAFASVEHIMRDVNNGCYYVICTQMELQCSSLQFMCTWLKTYIMVLTLIHVSIYGVQELSFIY